MKTRKNRAISGWWIKWVIPALGIVTLLSLAALNHSLTGSKPPRDLRKSALTVLQTGVDSSHAFVRGAAAKAAGDSQDPAVLPWILHAMDDDDPMVRTFSVESAARFKNPVSGIILRRGLEDGNLSIRLAAARVLGGYSGPDRAKITTLASGDPHPLVRLMALGPSPEGIPNHYMDSFRKIIEKGHPQEKIIAATALGNTQSPDAVPFLGQLMGDPDSAVRSFAARALGRGFSVDSLSFLKKGLRDESPEVRSEAVQAISRIEGLDPAFFLNQASNDPDAWVRLSAGLGFWKIGDDRSQKILEKTFSSRDFALRSAAARALGEMARDLSLPIPEDLFKALTHGLRDPSERVRSASSRALGMTGETRALDRLETVLGDPDPSVRCYAAGAILAILSAKHRAAGPGS